MTDVHQAFRSWNLHCRLNREALEAEKEDDEAALAGADPQIACGEAKPIGVWPRGKLGQVGRQGWTAKLGPARRGLGAGSQAAGSSSSRAMPRAAAPQRLLKYQSREGDLPLKDARERMASLFRG